jgi:hypothetical protein
MPIDAEHLAQSLLEAAYHAGGDLNVSLETSLWIPHQVHVLMDRLVAGLRAHKLRIKGVRCDAGTFAKFEVERDVVNSGVYNGVRLVMTSDVDFDTLEIVFRPQP